MGSSATSNFGCFTLARGERARTARGALLGEGDTALRGEGDVAFRGDLCGRAAGILWSNPSSLNPPPAGLGAGARK